MDIINLIPNNSNSFWGRQTKRDKIAIIAFAIDLVISLVLILCTVFLDDKTLPIGGRIALLTGNIVALIAAMQFSVGRFFDDQKDEIDKVLVEVKDVKTRITKTLEEMESITALGETYVKIFSQEEKIKEQYQSTLDSFLRRLSNCIDEKRSGALDIMTYYEVLINLADDIIEDKKRDAEQSAEYKGGIWALTFCLDDEWDDDNIHETHWFEKLKSMDQSGISTRRLWAFDKKMAALLKKGVLEDDGKELLQRLKLYCAKNTDFTNTASFALPKEEILDEDVRLFGKGFFAAIFSSGQLRLIRGVCFDNLLSSNSLGGEIDFDEIRIRKIRNHWEKYLKLAKPLNKFLFDIGSESAKEYMRALGFKED